MYSFSLRFPGGKRRAMTFSYDDGILADLRLIELMKKYGVKGTFNINTHHYENGNEPDNRLTKAQIKAIADDPRFEIACHGHRHPYYTYLPITTVTDDILENRKIVEEITGQIITGFAYPYGPYNKVSEQAIESVAIAYARTVKATNEFDLPENWLQWHPTCHHKAALENFEKFMGDVNPIIKPLVMYVWGHTYEFDNDNNWDLIEELFEKATKEEIWFATNMELYNYSEAFKSLVFSADGNTIHNPTPIDLWAICNANWKKDSGVIVKIPAGETITVQ